MEVSPTEPQTLVIKAIRDFTSSRRHVNLTRIIIAHRPETIKAANRVIVLQGGNFAHEVRQIDGQSAEQAAPRLEKAA
jgi:ATP-binding cassette subfamily B protein RaxB